MRIPGIEKLIGIGLDSATAQEVRSLLQRAVKNEDLTNSDDRGEYALSTLAEYLEPKQIGHGLEYIRHLDHSQHEVFGIDYINMGDPYIPTILFNHLTRQFMVAAWGDIVERAEEGTYP